MTIQKSEHSYRDRAEREIALARATGPKAHALAGFKTALVKLRYGTVETLTIPKPSQRAARV